MNILRNPAWLDNFKLPYDAYEDIPSIVFDDINKQLDSVTNSKPTVSIVIAAWNEEVNILRCVASLAQTKTDIPFEIIVVNNNSTDNTQKTLDRLNVRTFFQPIQGCGPARQIGQEQAHGKYILLADADCLYPEHWLSDMYQALSQKNVVCVYGRYSFIEGPGYARWKLRLFEGFKDIVTEFRHLYRPYFNAYGISMGYVREYGLKVGFIMINRRGDDGQLCLDMMEYGKVKQVRSNRARAWTGTRTLQQDGSFLQALSSRIKKEFNRFFFNLHSRLPNNGKTIEPKSKL